MKITYRVNKDKASKKQVLEGVRKGNQPTQEQVQKIRTEKLKRFDPTRVFLSVVLVFLVEILVLYLINFPVVRWSLDYFKNPEGQLPKVVYQTIRLQFGPEISTETQTEVKNKLSELTFEGKKRFEFVGENADVMLTYTAEKPESTYLLGEYYIVPVGHMYWLRDSMTKGNLQQDEVLVPTGAKTLYDEVLKKYGEKAPKTKEVPDLLAALKGQEKSVGFISVNDVNAQYKLLSLEGSYFYEDAPKGGIPYYLTLTGNSVVAKNLIKTRASAVFPESFNAESLLSVRMTGVTAITRGLGIKTNASKDPSYAARKIGDFLSKADLTHVSNEISMTNGCVPTGGVSFCMVSSHLA
ncbi:MAG: hypothetical protein ACOYT9_03495, partial [Patescibacteria group bacterium]